MPRMRSVLLCILLVMSMGLLVLEGAPRGFSFFRGFRAPMAIAKAGADWSSKSWLQPAMRASAMQKLILLLTTKNPRLLWVKFLGSQGLSGASKLPETRKLIDNTLRDLLAKVPSQESLILWPE
jgi:hypothetical protein